MNDFFKLFDEKFSKEEPKRNAEGVLNEFCKQINERWNDDKIVAILSTTSGDSQKFITYAVHLGIPDSNRYYSYRYLEVNQPIDKDYPIKIRAFQNPPSKPKSLADSGELREELTQILGDIRSRIVKEHLRQVANFKTED